MWVVIIDFHCTDITGWRGSYTRIKSDLQRNM